MTPGAEGNGWDSRSRGCQLSAEARDDRFGDSGCSVGQALARSERSELRGFSVATVVVMARREPHRGRPHVIVVAHSVDPADGGMETVHARLIAELLDEVDFTVVSCRLDPTLKGRVEWRRMRVPIRPATVRFPLFFMVASAVVARARRSGSLVHTCGAIIGNRVDVATVHTTGAAVVAARGGRLAPAGAPLLRRLNSGALRWMALRAERWTYRPHRCGVLAPVSEVTADELRQFYPGVPITVTPNGVDTERFHPSLATRGEVRAELGVGEAPMAMFVGGDFDRKGLGVAIEALVHAPSVVLVVAGPGDLERATRLAEDLGVADRLRLLGHRSDVERLDQAADLYCCASLYEADSLALLEAAACGLPLVSTRVGSAAQVIGEGEATAGLLVERTPEALGQALERLAGDVSLRASMSTVALERAATRRWDVLALRILDLYRSRS